MDANNDGIADEGEMPVAGVEMHLFGANSDGVIDTSVVLATAVTNEEGLYLFDGLAAGEYVVGIGPAAFGAEAPLADKIPSASVAVDPNNDTDIDNNGVLEAEISYVLSGPLTLGNGEPIGEVPSNDAITADANANLTVDFGFYLPVLDVDVELTLVEGAEDGTAVVGDLITFELTVTNDGNVSADSVELEVVLSDGFENVDPDGGNTPTIEIDGTVAPGEAATAVVTARVMGDDLNAEAEVSAARAVDDEGVPITSVLGVSIVNAAPEISQTNTALLPLTLAAPQAAIATTPGPASAAPAALALTGVESSHLALLAMLLLISGGALVALSSRRRWLVELGSDS